MIKGKEKIGNKGRDTFHQFILSWKKLEPRKYSAEIDDHLRAQGHTDPQEANRSTALREAGQSMSL